MKKHLKDNGAWVLKYWGGAKFTKSGIPDLLVCLNGCFLGIELKAPRGHPEELQLYHLNQIEKAGGFAILLYPKDFEQFKELIELIRNTDIDAIVSKQYQHFKDLRIAELEKITRKE